ncbi:hypothetical protein IWW36_005782 [Coemansia brasiliensis]|uniref:PB1 domain-containing protein n=1 Tax=Coemansia brasiliensis TaxID=2650707 RepID=A0A9W8LV16_9FUNG|nr:hypothetical protein IWW36_005782 [Coemansia brasiliensis]
MAVETASTAAVREEQRARVLKSGGRVLKFTNNGGKMYFRYYFPHPETLTWNKLTSGLRVLFSIASTDLYIRYTDFDGTKITVNDNNGLQIMFDETKHNDVVRIEVISEESHDPPLSSGSSNPQATMQMPMPMPPSGFPGMEMSRPESVMSNRTNMNGPNMNAASAQQPMNQAPPHSGSQGYGRVNNPSISTLPPPKPQEPLD